MLSKTSWMTVRTHIGDSLREVEYCAPDIDEIVRSLSDADIVCDDADWPGFLMGFAAAVDVAASGLLSRDFALGCAIRAFVDMKDPEAMPGQITDAGKAFEEARRKRESAGARR